MPRALGFALGLFLVPTMVEAQGPPREGSRARVTIDYHPEGDRYRTFEATVVRWTTDSLTVDLAKPRSFEPASWTIARGSIDRLEVPRGKARSTVKWLFYGAAAGAFLGAGIGGATHPREASQESICGENTPNKSALKCGLFGLAIGGAVGAAIGTFVSRTIWVEVEPASYGVAALHRYRLGLTVLRM